MNSPLGYIKPFKPFVSGHVKTNSLTFDVQAASYQPAFKRSAYVEPDDDTQCRLIPNIFAFDVMRFSNRDMILLGMKPSTTEAQVRDYFKDKADVVMVQVRDIQYH